MHSYRSKIESLQKAAVVSPEYGAIIPLFVELFRYLDRMADHTGITVTVPQERMKENLEHGFPLISAADLSIDAAACSTFLSGAIELLGRASNEGADELSRIEAAINDGTLDPGALFRAILERRRSVVDEAAISVDVPAPLLEYIFEIPLKAFLEIFAEGISSDGLEGWTEGFCPVCGSRAGMAEFAGEEGKRFLSCSACSFRWLYKRVQCPYCGIEDVDKLSYFIAGEGVIRVDTCKACSRYIKTRDSRKGNADVPLDVDDLLTIHLDLLAAKEGFERGK